MPSLSDKNRSYIYKGEVHKITKLPHGRGLAIYNDGRIIEGHFKDEVPSGKCRKID